MKRMSNGRRPRLQRTTVFLGCEGGSELGYGRWLNRQARKENVLLHIGCHDLHGGPPLTLVRKAKRKLDQPSADFTHRAILLDQDRFSENPENDAEAIGLADELGIVLIRQHPCHEGFVLRHFDGCERIQIRTSNDAERRLRRVWPDYRKGLFADEYEEILGEEHLRRIRSVHREFDRFLTTIGWD